MIGKHIYRVHKTSAFDHVAGYFVFNDGSVRDYPKRTTDKLPAGGAGLRLITRLNDQTMQSAGTNDMIFDVMELIVTLSAAMTLEPSDVSVSGTPAGAGAVRTPPVFIKAGDRCEISIEVIGVLGNPVVDQAPSEVL